MKIVETHDISLYDGYENSGKGLLAIQVFDDMDGNVASAVVMAGEPEDATFFRNLSGAYDFIDVVKAAYQAGKDGENVEFEFIDAQAPVSNPIDRLRELCGEGEVSDEAFEEIYEEYLEGVVSEGFSVKEIERSLEEGGRWSNYETTVYEVLEDEDCAYFELTEEVPATEIQEGMDLRYSLREVTPKEVTKTIYVGKGADD